MLESSPISGGRGEERARTLLFLRGKLDRIAAVYPGCETKTRWPGRSSILSPRKLTGFVAVSWWQTQDIGEVLVPELSRFGQAIEGALQLHKE